MIENIDINEIMGRLAQTIKASVSPYHTTDYALHELQRVVLKNLRLMSSGTLTAEAAMFPGCMALRLRRLLSGRDEWHRFQASPTHTDFP